MNKGDLHYFHWQQQDGKEFAAEKRAEQVARFCPPEPYEPPPDTRTIAEKMESHRAYAEKHLKSWHADEIERWLESLRRGYDSPTQPEDGPNGKEETQS